VRLTYISCHEYENALQVGQGRGAGRAIGQMKEGKEMRKGLRFAVSAIALTFAAGLAGEALATEGMFQHAYGLRHKALAGAGVASAEDATAISLNPAGLVDVGDQFNMGVSFFMPYRKYEATGTGFIEPGTHKSDKNFFPAPTLAYVRQLDADSAVAFSIFGNGGMNTSYPAFARTLGCPPGTPGTGAFCFGKAGVDLMQMFVSAAYARRFGDRFSIGIAPIFAMQRFKAYGLNAFAPLSLDPANFSGRGYDWSFGGGVRFGITYKPTDRLSFGASYQTKMWMSKFDKYAGLFENRGDFDIAGNLQVGLAYQFTDNLKVMLDYRRIFYSDVDAISNASITGLPFGASGGPGFGWRDTNTIKVGLEYQYSNDLILRAGYAYIWPNPVKGTDVSINIIAPGVIRHEITGGATWRMNANNDLDFAFMIAPTGSQTGANNYDGGTTKLSMYQLEFSVGWTYNFGAGSSRAR